MAYSVYWIVQESLLEFVVPSDVVTHFSHAPAAIPAFSNPELTENHVAAFVTVQSVSSTAVQEAALSEAHSERTPTTLSVEA